jgi:1,4-alpha-glucan branching enzyme
MEIRGIIQKSILRSMAALLLLCVFSKIQAQPKPAAGKCEFRNNEFLVEINKKATTAQLNDLIAQYDLKELDLKNVLLTNSLDTLLRLGWHIDLNNATKLIIKKPLSGSTNLSNVVQQIDFTGSSSDIARRFPSSGNGILFGYNRFRNKYPFSVKDGQVTFFLRNHLNATKVMLAGSFNNFGPDALRMKKTDSGWVAAVLLTPGKYWYKFIADGNWMIDEDNYSRENDGEGNTNSVYFQPNHIFSIKDAGKAKSAYLTGSFNNWKKRDIAMMKTAAGWQLPMYLANGTHTYKYIIDNVAYADAANADKMPDGLGGQNSVIRFGNSYTFFLPGFNNAQQVYLAGTFNSWKEKELLMQKTNNGWQLAYTIGPGNYQYKFIVDGKWMTDPGNPLTASLENETNSFIIIGANYTFRLKGMPNAKKVFLAGDFNNWVPENLAMKKAGNDWICSVYLSPGKHKYKFIVDGNWITDPANKTWEQNEHNTGNSVIWVDK